MTDTIFALSSGAPPAAVAVIRVSGPDAGAALIALAGAPLPQLRRATLRLLRDPATGGALDRALVLWLPGPGSATGEDCAELHVHAGRAVIAAVERALGALPGLRPARPGEFTRRAFAHGRIDLAEAEGLADLLAAETELQRLSAQAMAAGVLSRAVGEWRGAVLGLSAELEAQLDFADEGEVAGEVSEGEAERGLPPGFAARCAALAAELANWRSRPRAEPLREGLRVVLAGPPNAGKSTLFNALIESDAAIVTPEPGTTRDVLTAPVAIEGVPLVMVDTAGLREDGAGAIERIGIDRARSAAATADLVLWLGDEGAGPGDAPLWEVAAQADRADAPRKRGAHHRVSARTGEGIARLRGALAAFGRAALPAPGAAALNARQHALLGEAEQALTEAGQHVDPLLAAEALRQARAAFDRLTGRAGTEAMLDTLFGRFCIGK